MQAVIIAAGQGTRLSAVSDSKPLTPVAGVPLVERIVATAFGAGVDRFVVVTGYNSGKIGEFLPALASRLSVAITTVHNPEWEKANGLSVLRARGYVEDPFLLMMADHLFDGATMRRMSALPIAPGETVLAVDRRIENHPLVDMDDVTRVKTQDGRIVSIGKSLPSFDCFDTGLFLCTSGLFSAIEESAAAMDCSLSGGMRLLAARGAARVFDIGDAFWLDVDDEAALAKAERHVAAAGD
jgi:1L-myo-inositol 1-phosphate cytidylyltransferase